MKIASEDLLNQLIDKTKSIVAYVNELKKYSVSALNERINETSWSVLECLQHLNLYGDYYITETTNKLNNSKLPPKIQFKSGIIGNYFAQSMLPKEKLNKMKTFKAMNPIYSKLERSVIDTFLNQQETMLKLLEMAQYKNIEKIKTNISISKLLKIRIGDTFRFVIHHNLRHIQQAKNVISALELQKDDHN